jgi:TPR repeat protein
MSFIGQIDTAGAQPVDMPAAMVAPEADVLYEMGLECATGRFEAVDLVSAHKWFNLAALKGRRDAIAMRREIADAMSEAEIASAQRAARAWLTAH